MDDRGGRLGPAPVPPITFFQTSKEKEGFLLTLWRLQRYLTPNVLHRFRVSLHPLTADVILLPQSFA